jgi:hypothetical protein
VLVEEQRLYELVGGVFDGSSCGKGLDLPLESFGSGALFHTP